MKKIIVILGSGRSGTSLLTKIMHILGMGVSAEIIQSTENNRQGGWEDPRIFKASRDLLASLGRLRQTQTYLPMPAGWQNSEPALIAQRELTQIVQDELANNTAIWGFKEPVTAQLLPLWKQIFMKLNVEPIYILASRNPASVAKSFHSVTGTDPEIAEMIWLARNSLALLETDARLCVAQYECWFTDPVKQMQNILKYTGLTNGESYEKFEKIIKNVIDPGLNRSSVDSPTLKEPLSNDLYNLLKQEHGAVINRRRLMETADKYWNKMSTAKGLIKSIDLAEARYKNKELRLNKLEKEKELLDIEYMNALSEVSNLQWIIQNTQKNCEEKEQLLEELKREGQLLKKNCEEKDQLLEELKREGQLLKKNCEEKDQLLEELKREVQLLQINCEEKDNLAAELKSEKHNLNRRIEQLKKNINRLCSSTSFRFGRICVDAVARPGRNTLGLPVRLTKLVFGLLFRNYGNNPKKGSHSSPPTAKVIKTGSNALRNSILANNYFPDTEMPCSNRKKTNTIGCLTSNRLKHYLNDDVITIGLTPDNLEDIFNDQQLDLVLIESCISRFTKEWGLKGTSAYSPDSSLNRLLQECRTRGIHTVFWHTEPPIQTHLYKNVASECDSIYGVQQESVEELQRLTGRMDVDFLPWAIQPVLHNPIWHGPRPKKFQNLKIIMDGWADLLEYPDKFEAYLPLVESGLHILDSQWLFNPNKLDDMPRFTEAIMGCFSEAQMRNAIKHYKIALFSKYSLKSQSTRSRMMLESAAAKTLPVFHGEMDAPELEGIAVCHNSAEEYVHDVQSLLKKETELERSIHMNWRRVNSEHTYAHRLQKIYTRLGSDFHWNENPLVTCITITKRPEFLQHAKHNFIKQNYPNKEWLLLLNTTDVTLQKVERMVNDVGPVRVMQLHNDYNIGACLNFAILQAKGEICFKMDDDDFYGSEYISDMMLHQRCCDASFFGKSPAYTYFESEDALYLRKNFHEEVLINSPITNLCGATFAGKTKFLQQNTFSEIFRASVDSIYFHNCLNDGNSVLFNDIYNFVIFRSKNLQRHTWRMDNSYLQKRSYFVTEGKDFENVMI
jgi:hypothetical protein